MSTLAWIAVAVVVVLVAISALVWYLRRRGDHYQEYWQPLAPIVGGKASGNELTGAYQNMPLTACTSRNAGAKDERRYFWQVVLEPGRQGKDWTLRYAAQGLL